MTNASKKKSLHSHVGKLLGHDQPIIADERSAGGLHSLDTIGRERDIRGTGVAAVERPLCFAMADDEDPRSSHGNQLCILFFVSPLRSWGCSTG